ncbi:MAG TPA: hypothetical protein VFY73_07235 [Ideonella sp.]|uniref:hypothetical protein n=1 Tax=Ideonella sp. TaxID=1929293 RepID=UPI002E30E647|nr:hypothetical protein [Ideonella sp.]HEX5683813.1 hypothetical protein [Ideonella sp.]
MAKWRGRLPKDAWVAFLLVFAIRAMAGAALCESYGEHPMPPGASHSTAVHDHAAHDSHDAAAGHGPQASDVAPADGRGDHVCEAAVFLTAESSSALIFKYPMVMDTVARCGAPIGDFRLHDAEAFVTLLQFAHPPPCRTPPDISPRLRI